MRFLVDECAGPAVAEWLRRSGHDVVSIFAEAKGISDEDVLSRAVEQDRILITIDKDFGEIVFRKRRDHCGVIFLRLDDERSIRKIEVLQKLLESYSDRLPGQFVTATENKVRFG